MSIVSTKAYVVTKVKGISGINPDGVFDYEQQKWSVFPAIAVTLKDGNARFLTNTQNERHYNIVIRIYQEIVRGNVGAAAAEDNLRTLADNIITSFDNDIRLGRTDVWTIPITLNCGWIQDQPVRFIEFTLDCIDVVQAVG